MRRRFSDGTVDYMAAIKSSQRPSISSAYRFSLALIAYYDSIAVRTMRRDTAGRSLKAANVITSIRRVELKLALTSRLLSTDCSREREAKRINIYQQGVQFHR